MPSAKTAKNGLLAGVLFGGLVSITGPLSVGCVSGSEVPRSEVGPLPQNGEWQGVYRSGQGYIHLARQGSQVVGAWRVPPGTTYGRLSGKVRGNILTYEWVEYDTSDSKAVARSGHGYFVYAVPEEEGSHRLVGERSVGEGDFDQVWSATKRPDIRPNLAFAVPGTDGDRNFAPGYIEDESQYYVDAAEDQP